MSLLEVINSVPGKVSGTAKVCGVSVRAVYKWLNTGRLPRTDYSGETNYAEKISAASGGKFSASQILKSNKPQS